MAFVLFAFLQVGLAGAVSTPTAPCTCIENSLPKDSAKKITADLKGDGKLGRHYGDTCGVHQETFATACVDSDGNPKSDADDWCSEPWCWVDPCTCKLDDVERSSYFSAELYYSFSNCGGTDTYTTVSTAASNCSDYNYTPLSSCLPRMTNDDALHEPVTCTEDWGVFGKCKLATVEGAEYKYPANYGEGCAIHPEPGHSACSNTSTGTPLTVGRQAWCDDAWSWVNPCECEASDMAVSFYFPGLYYSYSVCGATDRRNTTATQPADITESAGCPSPAPPSATVESPGNYPGSAPVDQKCMCLALPGDVPAEDCTEDWAQSGKCVNATSFPGWYPPNYGTGCGVHMEPLSADCFDVENNRPWPSPCRGDATEKCRKAWCDSPWCYVDPCTCNDTSITDIAPSSYFPHAPNVYYSYANCKGVDTFTAANTTFDKDEACSDEYGGSSSDDAKTDSSGATSSAEITSALAAVVLAMW